jgi:hypothetical protein
MIRPIRNKNCPWRPYLLAESDEMKKFYRGSYIDSFYQAWFHFAQLFQSSRLKSGRGQGGGHTNWAALIIEDLNTIFSRSKGTEKVLFLNFWKTFTSEGNSCFFFTCKFFFSSPDPKGRFLILLTALELLRKTYNFTICSIFSNSGHVCWPNGTKW